jgi:hypothetical protein
MASSKAAYMIMEYQISDIWQPRADFRVMMLTFSIAVTGFPQ